MASSDTLDIDPAGDVVLICGADKMRIRVSSKMLSMGSPVFKAMLGPHFREGQQLAAGDAVEIPLPEDDATGLLPMIRLLHLDRSAALLKPSAKELLAVAIHADKYDCIEVTSFATQAWLSRLEETVEPDALITRLQTAAALGHRDLFARTCKDLMLHGRCPLPRTEPEHVPHFNKVLDLLDSSITAAIESIIEHVECLISYETDEFCNTGPRTCEASPDCAVEGARTVTLVRMLSHRHLRPAHSLKLRALKSHLDAMSTFSLKWPKHARPCSLLCESQNWRTASDICNQMREEAEEIVRALAQLCLICFKQGGGTFFAKNCEHEM